MSLRMTHCGIFNIPSIICIPRVTYKSDISFAMHHQGKTKKHTALLTYSCNPIATFDFTNQSCPIYRYLAARDYIYMVIYIYNYIYIYYSIYIYVCAVYIYLCIYLYYYICMDAHCNIQVP